jgi:hypothetical protein
MKVKILRAANNRVWYVNRVGETFEVQDRVRSDDTPMAVYMLVDGSKGIWKSDVELVTEPRLYNHEGVDYELPEWAKYVTKDSKEATKLYAWEGKPTYEHGKHASGYINSSGKRLDVLRPYVKPLPEGAFIAEV